MCQRKRRRWVTRAMRKVSAWTMAGASVSSRVRKGRSLPYRVIATLLRLNSKSTRKRRLANRRRAIRLIFPYGAMRAE